MIFRKSEEICLFGPSLNIQGKIIDQSDGFIIVDDRFSKKHYVMLPSIHHFWYVEDEANNK